MIEINAYQNRTIDFTGTLLQADGTTALALAAGDKLRVKIGVTGNTPLIDMVSPTETASGSSVTITATSPAAYALHLAQGDMTMAPGAYDIEIIVIDSAEDDPANAAKQAVDYGIIHVIGTQAGTLGA